MNDIFDNIISYVNDMSNRCLPEVKVTEFIITNPLNFKKMKLVTFVSCFHS